MASQLMTRSENNRISNMRCATHSHDYSFIYTNPSNTGIAFKCEYCVLEQYFDIKQLLSIK